MKREREKKRVIECERERWRPGVTDMAQELRFEVFASFLIGCDALLSKTTCLLIKSTSLLIIFRAHLMTCRALVLCCHCRLPSWLAWLVV